jgi:hypothetical protein
MPPAIGFPDLQAVYVELDILGADGVLHPMHAIFSSETTDCDSINGYFAAFIAANEQFVVDGDEEALITGKRAAFVEFIGPPIWFVILDLNPVIPLNVGAQSPDLLIGISQAFVQLDSEGDTLEDPYLDWLEKMPYSVDLTAVEPNLTGTASWEGFWKYEDESIPALSLSIQATFDAPRCPPL